MLIPRYASCHAMEAVPDMALRCYRLLTPHWSDASFLRGLCSILRLPRTIASSQSPPHGPFLLAIHVRLEIVLTHSFIPCIAMHTPYASVRELLARVEVLRGAFPVCLMVSTTCTVDNNCATRAYVVNAALDLSHTSLVDSAPPESASFEPSKEEDMSMDVSRTFFARGKLQLACCQTQMIGA